MWIDRPAWIYGVYISRDCTGFADKVKVVDTQEYGTWSIGRSLELIFEGEHGGAPGQFKFIEDEYCSLSGNQITLEQEVTQAAGTNIFYDVIPFEMLRTYETEP